MIMGMGIRHTTNVRLWFWCSFLIYCLLMAYPIEGAKGLFVGHFWYSVLSDPWRVDNAVVVAYLIAGLGGAAIILGWIAQAVPLLLWGIFRRRAMAKIPPQF
jgi:hypothetical protein